MHYTPSHANELSLPSQLGEPAWELATLFPHQGSWTEDEYLALNTNRLIELVDGRLEFLPMPTLFHQLILDYVVAELRAFVKVHALGGKVLYAPLRVRVASGKIREPDIIYFRPQRVKDVHRPLEGADLVMEIVSPGAENHERDFDTKREEYAAAGIAEYWIVDPESRVITVLALEGTQYRVHGEFREGSEATSLLLSDFSISVAKVFAAGEQYTD